MIKSPIFIIGLPRSGSTLFHNLIVMNPKIFRLAEMHYLNPWRKDFRYFLKNKVGDLSKEENIRKMIDMIFSSETIDGITGAFWRFENIEAVKNPEFKRELYNKISESDKSLESIFKILLEELTRFSGYNRFCVKFPVYVNNVPELLKWYPDCKIIHVTRDPRAIAMSKTNDPGGTAVVIKKYPYLKFFIRKAMIAFVIVQYIWSSRLHQKYKNYKNYALFKHEDLLAEPEKVLKELCEFMEVDYDPCMLELDKGRHEHQSSSVTEKKTRNIDKKAAVRWKAIITPFENIIITWLTKKSMKRFEYNPETHPVFKNDKV